MNRHIGAILFLLLMATACTNNNEPKYTIVKGSFVHTANKKVILAELPFGSTHRTIVDTTLLDAKGNFTLQTISKGEGIYQLFIENGPGILLINDVNPLEVHADANDLPHYTTPGSPVNDALRGMFGSFVKNDSLIRLRTAALNTLQTQKAKDSVMQVARQDLDRAVSSMKNDLTTFIQQQPNGTAVYFALGLAQQSLDKNEWTALIDASLKRFPSHPGINMLKAINTSKQTH